MSKKNTAAKLEIVATPPMEGEPEVIDLKTLLKDYHAMNAELSSREAAVEEAIKLRSGIVKAILEARGGKKTWRRPDGTELTLCRRGNLHFIRARKPAELLETEE